MDSLHNLRSQVLIMSGETIIPLQALGFTVYYTVLLLIIDRNFRPHGSTVNPALGNTLLLPSRLMKILALLILWNSIYCCYSQGSTWTFFPIMKQCELQTFYHHHRRIWGQGSKLNFDASLKSFYLFIFLLANFGNDEIGHEILFRRFTRSSKMSFKRASRQHKTQISKLVGVSSSSKKVKIDPKMLSNSHTNIKSHFKNFQHHQKNQSLCIL